MEARSVGTAAMHRVLAVPRSPKPLRGGNRGGKDAHGGREPSHVDSSGLIARGPTTSLWEVARSCR